MSAEITQILLENMPDLITTSLDKVEPTDLVLDLVWRQLRKNNPDLLEQAIGDEIEHFDSLVYNLADFAWVSTATTLQMFVIRKLRAIAYETIMGYESSILNADHCL